jgi:hypothetical protein
VCGCCLRRAAAHVAAEAGRQHRSSSSSSSSQLLPKQGLPSRRAELLCPEPGQQQQRQKMPRGSSNPLGAHTGAAALLKQQQMLLRRQLTPSLQELQQQPVRKLAISWLVRAAAAKLPTAGHQSPGNDRTLVTRQQVLPQMLPLQLLLLLQLLALAGARQQQQQQQPKSQARMLQWGATHQCCVVVTGAVLPVPLSISAHTASAPCAAQRDLLGRPRQQ